MSIAFTCVKELTFYDRSRAYNGYTLFTPTNGKGVWLIDMWGRYVNYWDMGYEPANYGELLPNGNLLYAGKIGDGPLTDLEGAGGILLEADWDGKVVWEYKDPYLHNAFHQMKNGNTLVIKWVRVPDDIAARVQGGDLGTEREGIGIMWGDAIQEVRPDGTIAWEWVGHEHLDPDIDVTCPLCPRSEWTHANAVVELADGNILVSLMKNNCLVIIDKKTGGIKWRWGGQGELAHQHCPTILDNGNILVFDNGFHQVGFSFGISRVLEINPNTDEMIWSYEGGENSSMFFYSSTMSSSQRLPNGNTLICEGTTGRVFEVSPKGELVWEYMNNLPSYEPSQAKAKYCMVYSAYRYGMDYPGLRRFLPIPERGQVAPGTVVGAKEGKRGIEEAVRSRLEALGY